MAKSDYGPNRGRKSNLPWLLDWAAGVLIGILALMIGAGILSLVFPQGVERIEAFRTMSAFVWPCGAALGVWLSTGRPMRGSELGLGLVASALGAGLALCPYWLGLESAPLRIGGAIVALIVAPLCARVAIAKLRARAD